jgi:hypothetical protein
MYVHYPAYVVFCADWSKVGLLMNDDAEQRIASIISFVIMPIRSELSSGSISLWRIKGLPTCHLHFEWLRLETKDGVVVAVTITVIYQRQSFIACAIGVVYVFLHPTFNSFSTSSISETSISCRMIS